MSDEEGMVEGEVLPLQPRKVRPAISRTEAKKLRNLHTVAIHRMTDDRERTLRDRSEELTLSRQKLTNACAVLEAVVRRHGTQVFNRKEIESTCANGNVQFDVTTDRISVRLRDKPVEIDTGVLDKK